MKRDGGPVFPAHVKTGHPHGPFRGLPANENARALISMVAQSTCSNQRPDTLMQDRRADRSTKPSCDARPDHTLRRTAGPYMWVRTFDTIEELRAALLDFATRYNETWLVARHGYRTPAQVRADQCRLDPNTTADLELAA